MAEQEFNNEADGENTITLDRDEVIAIREALLIGLYSYSEVDRLSELWAVMEGEGKPLPAILRPVHPTGSDDTVKQISEALLSLNHI